MSLYQLKPAFQSCLRPFVRQLHHLRVSANAVTVFTCAVSVGLGLGLYFLPAPRILWLLMPIWMLLRMALNAMDGMLAREFGQTSVLGAYLNELTDVLADAALLLPFVLILPGSGLWIALLAVLAALAEMAGVLGQSLGSARRYDGPMGKSDRAAMLGLVGFAAAFVQLPAWTAWLMPLLCALTAITIINRVRAGIAQVKR